MLQQTRLLGNLQAFCDPDAATFGGFPATREQARHAWAHAFADYASVIEEAIARPPPPPDSHPSLDLSGVEQAFFADLGLDATLSAAEAAADFAGAWQQAILAITATPAGATDSSSAIYTFGAFSNATTLHDALRDRLAALFQVPASSAAARLSDIATAFHDATGGLSAAVTITTAGAGTAGVMSVR
jgi:hypothetical protein